MITYWLILLKLVSICSVQDVIKYSKSPDHLEAIYFKYFEYKITPDGWNDTPEDFLKRRTGDCKNFATFTKYVLEQKGYNCELVKFYTPHKKYGHVICLYSKDDTRGYFTNQYHHPEKFCLHCLANAWNYERWEVMP